MPALFSALLHTPAMMGTCVSDDKRAPAEMCVTFHRYAARQRGGPYQHYLWGQLKHTGSPVYSLNQTPYCEDIRQCCRCCGRLANRVDASIQGPAV